ncbi:ATP5L [Branchiostoma lanceolatum]|uniref:ATP synthase subunit g n=1 Tax=Branchiostoma lanceolatum TaxID=7740 RepID=A0A8J9ZJW9_BRALA|nr:ATP5L [Branchiostoma lanceolatum]
MAALAQRMVTALTTKGPVLAKNAVEFSKPRLQTFWYYAKVEMIPPTPAEIPKITEGFSNLIKAARTGAWMQTTVREGVRNTVVVAEIGFWFFIGEIIGRRSLIGYNV